MPRRGRQEESGVLHSAHKVLPSPSVRQLSFAGSPCPAAMGSSQITGGGVFLALTMPQCFIRRREDPLPLACPRHRVRRSARASRRSREVRGQRARRVRVADPRARRRVVAPAHTHDLPRVLAVPLAAGDAGEAARAGAAAVRVVRDRDEAPSQREGTRLHLPRAVVTTGRFVAAATRFPCE